MIEKLCGLGELKFYCAATGYITCYLALRLQYYRENGNLDIACTDETADDALLGVYDEAASKWPIEERSQK